MNRTGVANATALLYCFIFPALALAPLFTAKAFADYNPMMRPDARVDRFVQRIYARYGLLPEGFHRQPMGIADFAAFLDTLSKLPITVQERYAMDGLRGHLSLDKGLYGFRGDGGTDNSYGLIVNLDLTANSWAWAGDGGDPRGGGSGVINPQLRGHIGRLSFYSSLDVWTEYVYDSLFTRTSYEPYDGVPYELYGREAKANGGNMRSSDLPRCGVVFDAGRLSLQAGIDYLRLGPAAHFPITLSGGAPPITYARGLFDLTYMEYHHTVGVLRSQKDKSKYIYANGLTGDFRDGLVQWGVSEVMVGGSATNQQDNDPINKLYPIHIGEEQGWEWAFFIPFVPMVFVEHYVGDKNNSALAFDVTLNWPKGFRFYAEFFLDDMLAPWKILSDDWGNKWAATLGAQYFTNWKGRDISAGLEASRVEPWVYTHVFGGSHRYDHFDKCLGSEMGPNTMAIAVSGDMSVTKKGTLGVRLTSLSSNPTVRGGKITDIFQYSDDPLERDSETKKFLGPGTTHCVRPGVYGYYDPLGLFRLNAGFDIDVAENRGRAHFQLDGGFRF
ncbi:MAG: hypothetical protein LBH93_08540 [Chitinispirillales bacterium]|jgi:hypothetical protein|nr:hypothetical protein [Chitinispirillales bacterium]